MNNNLLTRIARLSDRELIETVSLLARREQEATATLVAHLVELENRDLHLAEGCSSLFGYCVQVLHLSEHAAYNRIEAARAARKFPVILEDLAAGRMHLTAIRLIAPHLTADNHRILLDAVRHRSRREIEEFLVRLRPLPPVATMLRRLPGARRNAARNEREPAAGLLILEDAPAADGSAPVAGEGALAADLLSGSAETAANPAEATSHEAVGPSLVSTRPARPPAPAVVPLSSERYKIQFTARAETRQKLREAQELLRHQIPDGDVAEIVDQALTLLVEKLRKAKFAQAKSPAKRSHPSAHKMNGLPAKTVSQTHSSSSPRTPFIPSSTRLPSRHIPSAVRREVWQRDGGRCAFRAPDGKSCVERGKLEFHHVKPFALGGTAVASNIELRCHAHNSYESKLCFGRRVMFPGRGLDPVGSGLAARSELVPERVHFGEQERRLET